MIGYTEFELVSADGRRIAAWSVIPEKSLAALQMVHGMMEHSGRYIDFARWLAKQGIAVYMNDHRGHGKNLKYVPGQRIQGDEIYGHFGNRKGWRKSLEILHHLTRVIKEKHPDIPLFILGHSMGSVLVQSYLRQFSNEVNGAILSGPLLQPRHLLATGIALVDMLKIIFGCRFRSRLLKNLGYGSYSKYFHPKRTDFDWLCSDPKVVDEYIQDPLCGFLCTTAFYSDFFGGIRENQRAIKILGETSICIFAGKNDPTGHFGKDPELMAGYYRVSGCRDVELKIWPDGRHEMLNELNKAEVWEFVRSWIVGHLPVREG